MRAERADAERNRLRVLDAAARLLAEDPSGTTMEQIALAAGVGKGTLYRRYPDRTAIAAALLDEHERDLQDRICAARPRPRPAAGRRAARVLRRVRPFLEITAISRGPSSPAAAARAGAPERGASTSRCWCARRGCRPGRAGRAAAGAARPGPLRVPAEELGRTEQIAGARPAGRRAAGAPAPGGAMTDGSHGVRELRLVVTAEDYDAALRFYRDVLGLHERAAFVADGRARLDPGGGPGHAGADRPAPRRLHRRGRGRPPRGGHIRVAFEVDDSRRRRRRWRRRAPPSSPSRRGRRGTRSTRGWRRRPGCS